MPNRRSCATMQTSTQPQELTYVDIDTFEATFWGDF
jgi:hypothetical protein